jgi:FSR family fosmidomycin resistance protein-like MFS transporter
MLSEATPELGARRSRTWLWPFVLFCLGHFFIDLYSGSLGVLQPLLRDRFSLSFTRAGILGGTLVFSSSVMQPVYGYLSDRFRSRLFSALAPAMAGFFLSSLGWAPGWWGLLAMVVLGGVGVAAFHPQAAVNAVTHIAMRRGKAMAIFISSGAVGMAAGPAGFSLLLRRGGLDAAPWGAAPGILVTILLLALLPPPAARDDEAHRFDWAPLRAVWRPLTILYMLVFIRSIVQVVFAQFLPLYLHTERGYSLPVASGLLSLYLLGGALGGFAGGNLADRFGGRAVILVSMLGSSPLLFLFLFTHGPLSAAALFLGGLILLFTIPVNVVMAQDLVPTLAGTVSALMMGFAWGTAGLVFIPLTGWISDHYSMQAAFTILVTFPLLGSILGWKLPK